VKEKNVLDIKDSVAVITGGASGLGLALAEYWVKNGGKVVLADISGQNLRLASSRLKGAVTTMVCDVTREEDCARLADTAIEVYGQINMLAPFAGIIKHRFSRTIFP
jgi:3-oxoacyl-[acyl-carrier protein] reductase